MQEEYKVYILFDAVGEKQFTSLDREYLADKLEQFYVVVVGGFEDTPTKWFSVKLGVLGKDALHAADSCVKLVRAASYSESDWSVSTIESEVHDQ